MGGSRLRELDKIDKVESSLSQRRITWNNLLRYNRTMFYAWKKRKTDLDTIRSPLLIQSFRERKTTRKGRRRDESAIRRENEISKSRISFAVESDFDANLPLPAVVFDEILPEDYTARSPPTIMRCPPLSSDRKPIAIEENITCIPIVFPSLSLSLSKEGKKRKRRKRKINELALVQIDAKRFE